MAIPAQLDAALLQYLKDKEHGTFTSMMQVTPSPSAMTQQMLDEMVIKVEKAAKIGDLNRMQVLLEDAAAQHLIREFRTENADHFMGMKLCVVPHAGPNIYFRIDQYAIQRYGSYPSRRSAEFPLVPDKTKGPNYGAFYGDDRQPVNGSDVDLPAFSEGHLNHLCLRANVPNTPENKRIGAYAVGMSLDLLLRHLNENEQQGGDDLIEEFRYMLEAFATEHGFPRFDAWKK